MRRAVGLVVENSFLSGSECGAGAGRAGYALELFSQRIKAATLVRSSAVNPATMDAAVSRMVVSVAFLGIGNRATGAYALTVITGPMLVLAVFGSTTA